MVKDAPFTFLIGGTQRLKNVKIFGTRTNFVLYFSDLIFFQQRRADTKNGWNVWFNSLSLKAGTN